MKLALQMLFVLFGLAAVVAARDALLDVAEDLARDSELIELHRGARVCPGVCLYCRAATFERYFDARPGQPCIAADRENIDALTRRAARRLQPTSSRRLQCASARY